MQVRHGSRGASKLYQSVPQ